MNSLIARITHEFDLGAPLEHEPLSGGGAAFKLRTTRGIFVVKRAPPEPELTLYLLVAETLDRAGVRQARLYASPEGALVSSDGHAVFEFLEGDWTAHPTPAQTKTLARYFARYNQALRTVPMPPFVTEAHSPWKKADSLDYLLYELPARLARLSISPRFADTATFVLEFLAEVRPDLDRLPKQLVHGDVGPGNILYDGDHAAAIIDFTPYYASHVYSLCVSFYWHYGYYHRAGGLDLARIGHDLAVYASGYPFSHEEQRLFYAVFVKVAARILFVPLVFHLEAGHPLSLPECDKLATALDAIRASRRALDEAIARACSSLSFPAEE